MQSGLPPLDPAVIARRKRQNRIIIALLVMIGLPGLIISGSIQYGRSMVTSWASGQTFPFNTETSVHLSKPGDYVIWTYNTRADCQVILDTVFVQDDGYPWALESGYYKAATFTANRAGDYLVTCRAIVEGHAMVSTEAVTESAGLLIFGGIVVGVTAGLAGLTLLILGLVNNASDKRRANQPPWGPAGPIGGPPTRPAAPPWPPAR